jgi:hypothetical protein
LRLLRAPIDGIIIKKTLAEVEPAALKIIIKCGILHQPLPPKRNMRIITATNGIEIIMPAGKEPRIAIVSIAKREIVIPRRTHGKLSAIAVFILKEKARRAVSIHRAALFFK